MFFLSCLKDKLTFVRKFFVMSGTKKDGTSTVTVFLLPCRETHGPLCLHNEILCCGCGEKCKFIFRLLVLDPDPVL